MLDRRRFLKLISLGTVLGNMTGLLSPFIKKATASGELKRLPVIMIEGGTCTGDSISFNNIITPSFKDILSKILEWRYDWVSMQTQGDRAIQVIEETAAQDSGRYILILQGTMIRRDQGHYNHVLYRDGKFITGIELVRELGLKAGYVVTIGTCAAFGGIVSGYPNPTQSVGVQKILPERRVINIPGCPAHPDWIMGTMLHLVLYGEPEMDSFGRPLMFYGETVHDNCPRRSYYDQGIFATDIGQKECLYRVGCKGPVTYADCPLRHWNDKFNWPIACNSPCIGCTEPGFPDKMEPFTSHFQDIPLPGGTKVTTDHLGLGILGLAGTTIIGHAIASLGKGRLHKKLLQSTIKVPHRPTIRKSQTTHQYRLKSKE